MISNFEGQLFNSLYSHVGLCVQNASKTAERVSIKVEIEIFYQFQRQLFMYTCVHLGAHLSLKYFDRNLRKSVKHVL